MKTKKKLPIKKSELAWYVIAGIFGVWGLTFVVFGIVGDHLPMLASENWILTSEAAWLTNWSHIGYRWWGLILLGVGVLLAVIVLTVYARNDDRDSERAARRAQRLAMEVSDEPSAEEAK